MGAPMNDELPPAAPERLASPQELAIYLGVPVNTIYRWRTRGDGPRGTRVGKHIRFKWADVDRWLEEQADRPASVA
jgi:excisionase family DNA binding protein